MVHLHQYPFFSFLRNVYINTYMPMKSKIASWSSKQQWGMLSKKKKQQWGMGKTHDGAHHRMEYSTD